MDDEVGSLAAGKLADLVAVAGRPDQRISGLRGLRLVVKGGSVFRSELEGLDEPGVAMPGIELAGGMSGPF